MIIDFFRKLFGLPTRSELKAQELLNTYQNNKEIWNRSTANLVKTLEVTEAQRKQKIPKDTVVITKQQPSKSRSRRRQSYTNNGPSASFGNTSRTSDDVSLLHPYHPLNPVYHFDAEPTTVEREHTRAIPEPEYCHRPVVDESSYSSHRDYDYSHSSSSDSSSSYDSGGSSDCGGSSD